MQLSLGFPTLILTVTVTVTLTLILILTLTLTRTRDTNLVDIRQGLRFFHGCLEDGPKKVTGDLQQ